MTGDRPEYHHNKSEMNDAAIFASLEKRFVSTFLDELLPGIFHNFANPLNGIMGRSRLMQRRLDDFIRKIEQRYPEIESESAADYRKLVSDINAINDASEGFFAMFQLATGKFYALSTRVAEKVNISALIQTELGFADFYLEYKHNVMKEVELEMGVPAITGITAYYSIAFWALIREAARNAQRGNGEPLRVRATSDNQAVIVTISHIGGSLVPEWREILFTNNNAPKAAEIDTYSENNLLLALILLKMAGSGVEMNHDRDADLFTIRIRYGNEGE